MAFACKNPDFSNRAFSQGQVDTQARFKRAIRYGREASKTRPLYEALAEGQPANAYNLALSDWFKPPVIDAIQRRKGPVRMTATDNILVTEVHNKILDGGCNRLLLSLHLKDEPNNTIFAGPTRGRSSGWQGAGIFPLKPSYPGHGFRSFHLGYLDAQSSVAHALLFYSISVRQANICFPMQAYTL